MKAIVWGTGGVARDYIYRKVMYSNYEILAFTDNNSKLWGQKYYDYKILSPADAIELDPDIYLIWTMHYKDIINQLEKDYQIPRERIVTYKDIDLVYINKLKEKYGQSSDEQIRKVLSYYETNRELNIYGYYKKENVRTEVFRDKNNQPYILFDNKKMFYPEGYSFIKEAGKEFLGDVLYEQGDNSPHRYITEKNEIKKGSVIVDAGVCEGNFALRYVNVARRIYLIESDPNWMEVLKRTFEPYRNKVVFCQKYLTRYDSDDTITLDTLVNEPIDFLKMDIEGYEIDALLGAKKTLKNSEAKCAICSYHKQNDEENIKMILENYGYITDTSDGYMFFYFDEGIGHTLDLRKGIVYGERCRKSI